jgi:hypothetical protein
MQGGHAGVHGRPRPRGNGPIRRRAGRRRGTSFGRARIAVNHRPDSDTTPSPCTWQAIGVRGFPATRGQAARPGASEVVFHHKLCGFLGRGGHARDDMTRYGMGQSLCGSLMLIILSLYTAGCGSTLYKGLTLGTRDIAVPMQSAGPVEGHHCVSKIFMIIPTGAPARAVERAIADALSHAPRAMVLMDVDVTSTVVAVPPLFLRTCFNARGEAMRLLEVRHEN